MDETSLSPSRRQTDETRLTPSPCLTPPRPAFPPRVLVPGFDLLDELGRGGMGIVYKARQHGLNRLVALKMLLSAGRLHEGDQLRFLTEAEAVAAVKHPHVVQVYEFGEADGHPYLAMEYVNGGSLSLLLSKYGRLTPPDAARLVEQITRGVQAAHEQGIVHRDLKPANILLQLQGQNVESRDDEETGSGSSDHPPFRLGDVTPKVSDFGIAKRGGSADLTLTGVAMGTPAYMSPEQARGQTKFVGPGADVYALGVILYECLTGQVPFDGSDSVELMQRVARDDPPRPRKFAPNLPPDLELICLKCLQKWPHERYPTAAALADDLRRFLAGDPVSVRPPGQLEKAVKWVRKYPTRAAIYGLTFLAVALGGLAGGALTLWHAADAARGRADSATHEARSALAKAEEAKVDTERERVKAENARRTAETERTKAEAAAAGEAAARRELALQKALHDIDLAHREYEANNLAQARRLLDGCPADYRPWEWRFVDRLCRREAKRFETGEPMIYGLAFVAGSNQVLTATVNGLRAWDLQTLKSTQVASGVILKLAASPDNKRFAAVGIKELTVLDLSTDKILLTLSGNAVFAAFDPSGKKVLVGKSDGATLRELATGTSDSLPASELAVWCGAVSKTGEIVVAGQAWMGQRPGGHPTMAGAIKLWRSGPKGSSEVITLNTDAAIKSAVFSPDGSRLAAGCDDGAVVVFNLSTNMAAKFRGHTSTVTSVAFDAAGERLASSSADRTVRVWEVSSGAQLQAFKGHTFPALAVAFSPDGTQLASAGEDGTVRFWDPATPPDSVRLARMPSVNKVNAITVTDDGTRIVLADGLAPIRGFDRTTGAQLWPQKDAGGEPLASLWIDSAKNRVVGVTQSAGLVECDLATGGWGLPIKRFSVQKPVWVSANLSRALTTSENDWKVRIHDLRSGATIATTGSHPVPATRPIMSTDGGRVLTTGADHKAIVWNADTGAKVCELVGHIGTIWSGAFSPDGTRVATCGDERDVKLWDSATGRELLTFRLVQDFGWAIGWSPDGSKLVVLDLRGVAHIWDAGPPAK